MLDSEEGFTYTWEVENFSMLPHQTGEGLKSSTFVVDKWGDLKWRLILYPRGRTSESEGYISIYLLKIPEAPYADRELKFAFSVTLVSTDQSSSTSWSSENYLHNTGFRNFMKLDYFFGKKFLYLPNDTLTLRCHILSTDQPSDNKIVNDKSESASAFMRHCKTRTSLDVNRRFITLHVQNIKELRDELGKASFDSDVALLTTPSFNISLHFTDFLNIDFVRVEISQTNLPSEKEKLFVKCKMTVISPHQKYQDSNESSHLFQRSFVDIWHFPTFIMTSNLTRDKYLYLDDTLLLQCEFAYSYKSTVHHMETNNAPLTFQVKEERNASELANNLKDLYSVGKFCDVHLRAGGETFPAHKVVLCAMSPVFRAMFENDSKEKDSNVVEIEDVDPNTLRRMLAYYMHSDSLGKDLYFESTRKLFSVADKYDLEALKRRCSVLLVSSLCVDNVCDVLTLADDHQDNFLMTAVHNFIGSHANETFYSKHWKSFMDIDPKLSGEIMHQMWMKK